MLLETAHHSTSGMNPRAPKGERSLFSMSFMCSKLSLPVEDAKISISGTALSMAATSKHSTFKGAGQSPFGNEHQYTEVAEGERAGLALIAVAGDQRTLVANRHVHRTPDVVVEKVTATRQVVELGFRHKHASRLVILRAEDVARPFPPFGRIRHDP